MAMFMVKPWYKKDDFDPDACFDENNTATEENFIKLLEHGVYDSKYIGYFVTLSNSVDYNGGKWVIADVNHDSTNTGQTNCYDLVSLDIFYATTYSGEDNVWRTSYPRTWLNNTFYPGFGNDIKLRILNIKYYSKNAWYNDDKVIMPSCDELNLTTAQYKDTEGIPYPIFTDNASRKKRPYDSSSYEYYWTRTRWTTRPTWLHAISESGTSAQALDYYYSTRLAAVLRIS